MRGATGGEANSRTDGTRLCTEQSLEVEELGLRQPACGSASLVPNGTEAPPSDEEGRLY
jgi:hypothetical protein